MANLALDVSERPLRGSNPVPMGAAIADNMAGNARGLVIAMPIQKGLESIGMLGTAPLFILNLVA
jgi:hypothetical protein